jgi:hypothetical protein
VGERSASGGAPMIEAVASGRAEAFVARGAQDLLESLANDVPFVSQWLGSDEGDRTICFGDGQKSFPFSTKTRYSTLLRQRSLTTIRLLETRDIISTTTTL